jgi:hypothetical protein
MKKLLAVLAVLAVVSGSSKAFAADGTINLNNYDSNNPIFHGAAGTRLPVAGSFVQMLGGPVGGTLQVLSSGGLNMFTLTEPGFFDGGFAVVPGVAESGTGSFQIRAWTGGAASYDAAIEKGASTVYSNATGTNPALPAPPVPAANTGAPSFVVAVPEPSTVILGLLGAGALLFRRRK